MGSIATKEAGIDFSDVPNMVAAYFACVNANGGINGHPLKLFEEFDQGQPSQVTAAANKLVDSDRIVAMVGNTDLIECAVDRRLLSSTGIYEIANGIAPECWSTPNSVPINQGPRYSSDAAVQYAIAQAHPKKIVFDNGNSPDAPWIAAGAEAIAKADHVQFQEVLTTDPLSDPNSIALSLVDDAGPDGVVMQNNNPPEIGQILDAAQKLGLSDRVKMWVADSPADTDFLAKTLGPKWNHKLFVSTEVQTPDDHSEPQMQLYKAILAKYGHAVAGGVGAFSEFGFLDAGLFIHALEDMKPPYTRARVSAAIANVKNYTSPMECLPMAVGKLPLHIPNYSGPIGTPDNGKIVTIQSCLQDSDADPQIARYRKAATAAGFGS